MSSYTLNIQVEGGRISSDYNVLTADSVNHIVAAFTFDQSWEGLLKTAVFRVGELVYHIPLEDDACLVPFEVLKEPMMYLSVFGTRTIVRATTTELPIQIQNSGYTICEPTAPTPDPYNYFLERVTELKSATEEAAEQTATNHREVNGTVEEIRTLSQSVTDAGELAEQSNREAQKAAEDSQNALREIETISKAVEGMKSSVDSSTAIAQNAAEEAVNTTLLQLETHNKGDNSLAHPNIVEIAETAKSIALGKANSLCFETKEELLNWLSGDFVRFDGKNVSDLKTGDNLYIVELGVPDYWWDGTNIQPLGAEKPDFSDYYTKNQIDSRLSDASFDLISSEEYYSLYQSGSLEAGKIYLVFEEE